MTSAPPPTYAQQRARMVRPVLVVAFVTILVLMIIGTRMVAGADRASREHEQAMVERGLQLRLGEIGKSIAPQVDWDDAVTNMSQQLKPSWANSYYATFLNIQIGATRAFVLDPGMRPIYGASYMPRDGMRDRPDRMATFAPFAPVTRDLMPALREMERNLPEDARTHGVGLERAVHVSGLTRIDGQLWIVSLHLIQPDGGKVRLRPGPMSTALVAIPMDAPTLSQFGQRYRIDDPSIVDTAPADEVTARVALNGPDDKVLGWLVWTPRRPGSTLLSDLALPLFMLVLAFCWGAWIFVREAGQLTEELIASESRARHAAYHDTLTGLPNRGLMFDRLTHQLAIARRHPSTLAIHCLDLDRFKEVNDTMGHPAGDELLKKVAATLTHLCRESDTVARLGGDEFVILQPGATASGASHLAERIVKALGEPFDLAQGTVEIGVSIGVTLVNDPELDASEALRQADLALYSSKEAGRNCATFFEPEMDAALRVRRVLESDLRKALADNAIFMAYQPQINQAGRVCGVEALVRWNHPEKGPIPPNVFIPLAEESGLIQDLGEYILRRVFEETQLWPGLRVGINLSAAQLRSPVFMAMVSRLMAEYRIDPAHYEFEVTESAITADDGATRNNLLVLSQEGFTIALDDFGTGYSNLTNLRRFAVDKIKIDRSFIQNIDAGEEGEALIDAIVRLSSALKLDVVAEGVETESQRERLARCGCNHFQGYLVSRPMPADEIARMIPGG